VEAMRSLQVNERERERENAENVSIIFFSISCIFSSFIKERKKKKMNIRTLLVIINHPQVNFFFE